MCMRYRSISARITLLALRDYSDHIMGWLMSCNIMDSISKCPTDMTIVIPRSLVKYETLSFVSFHDPELELGPPPGKLFRCYCNTKNAFDLRICNLAWFIPVLSCDICVLTLSYYQVLTYNVL